MSNTKNKSIRDQLSELDSIIDWFNQEEFDLDEALTKFESGMKMVDSIKTQLSSMENKITVLKERFDVPRDKAEPKI